MPGDGEGGWRPERGAWAVPSSDPASQLAALVTRIGRIEDDLREMRTEAKNARIELRDEVRGRFDDIIAAKADAYRIAQLEITVTTMATDLKASLLAKANVWVVNLLAVVVFGFVGIILTAVAYNILEARATIPEHVTITDHSGSSGK